MMKKTSKIDDGSTYEDASALNSSDPNYDSEEETGKEFIPEIQKFSIDPTAEPGKLSLVKFKRAIEPIIEVVQPPRLLISHLLACLLASFLPYFLPSFLPSFLPLSMQFLSRILFCSQSNNFSTPSLNFISHRCFIRRSTSSVVILTNSSEVCLNWTRRLIITKLSREQLTFP